MPPAPVAEAPRVRVVAATPGDWARARTLRLAALADTPDAFGATLDGERDQPEHFWRARVERRDVATLLVSLRADDNTWRDAGLAVVCPCFDDPAIAGLYSVWISPDARGRGAGEALLSAAVAHAREAGFPRIVLDVGDRNERAIRAYRRAGFLPTGRTSALAPPREHITEHQLALDLTPAAAARPPR